MEQNTVYLNLSTAQHVSGGNSTHHQQLITLYLQYLVLIRPVVNVAGSSNGLVNVRYCRYSDTYELLMMGGDTTRNMLSS